MTARGKILVTPRSLTARGDDPHLQRLRDAGFELVFCTPGKLPSEEELLRVLPGCVGYLAGVETISARVLRSAPGLRVIARNGAGTNNVDLAAAEQLGIDVRAAPGANARGVAELTLALILALARSVPFSDRAIKAGRWERRTGIELEGRTLGIIGCGNVGKRVARMALAMDLRVVAFDTFPDAAFTPGGTFRYATLNEVIATADVVTLHCPPPPDGRAVLDAAALARLKPGALVINTARAELIDRAALTAALESGRVAGVGLDVFDREPPGDDPLLKNDRVIATPHVGGLTSESVERAVGAAVDNLLAHLDRAAP